ncbi:uncharacterized protein RSE6_14735 [Rhynchosporium secalis]|uniref:Uncharacterized protein n=1 Tax=Rhynchosporium secalis TaxID=38038 RepID=A0A1E1MW28_RHYSE|nr:uncharacterized protein RSE6_14735 [Rhynchosporium secalis]
MSSSHRPYACPLALNKKRQHDSEHDDDYSPSGSTKKRRSSEHLESKNNSKTKSRTAAPLQNMKFGANNSHELGNSNLPLRDRVINNTDPSSPESPNDFVQEDDRRVGSHKDRTVSVVPQDDYVENKSSSDHRGDIKLQSSQHVGYDNETENSELLPENEEEDSRMQILPCFRKIKTSDSLNKKPIKDVPCHSTFRSPSPTCYSQEVFTVAQQNRHLPVPTTKPKSGSSSAPRSLLQKVHSRSGASIPLKQFSFREDEIEFVDIIGESFEEECHARTFRITAGGRNFALKHKYWESDMSQSHSQYPPPNQRFDQESTTYARTAHLQDLPTSTVPKCYGYVELTKIPQARSRHQRNPFRSTWYSTAAYLDFLIQEEDCRGTENQQWKRYFRDKPPSACFYVESSSRSRGDSFWQSRAQNSFSSVQTD